MEATYTVNVGPGQTVEMTGQIDALDRITAQMQSADALLEACQKFVATFDPGKGSDIREIDLGVAHRMALRAVEKATQ